jgi:hypothetical protein
MVPVAALSRNHSAHVPRSTSGRRMLQHRANSNASDIAIHSQVAASQNGLDQTNLGNVLINKSYLQENAAASASNQNSEPPNPGTPSSQRQLQRDKLMLQHSRATGRDYAAKLAAASSQRPSRTSAAYRNLTNFSATSASLNAANMIKIASNNQSHMSNGESEASSAIQSSVSSANNTAPATTRKFINLVNQNLKYQLAD